MALTFKERLALAAKGTPVKETTIPIVAPAVPVIDLPVEEKPKALAIPESVVDLGAVIAAHNTIANKSLPEPEEKEVDPLSGVEASSVVKELQQRIANLATLEDGTSLRGEVGLLKEMITKNGDACRYLLNEDLGLFVRALRRMTDNKVAQDMGRAKTTKATKAKEVNLSAADMAGLLNDLDLSL